MAHLQINLRASEKDALIKLAKEQLRDPRDQAALIIRDYLQGCGRLSLAHSSIPDAANQVKVSDAITQ